MRKQSLKLKLRGILKNSLRVLFKKVTVTKDMRKCSRLRESKYTWKPNTMDASPWFLDQKKIIKFNINCILHNSIVSILNFNHYIVVCKRMSLYREYTPKYSRSWKSEVAQSSDSLWPHGLYIYSPPGSSVHGILQAGILEWGCHVLLQGIFPTQGSNPGLPHYRQALYPLSHQG